MIMMHQNLKYEDGSIIRLWQALDQNVKTKRDLGEGDDDETPKFDIDRR